MDYKQVKLVNVPQAEDKDKNICVDGKQIAGTVYRGWLRSGGDQWVLQMPNFRIFGATNLTDIRKTIARRIASGAVAV